MSPFQTLLPSICSGITRNCCQTKRPLKSKVTSRRFCLTYALCTCYDLNKVLPKKKRSDADVSEMTTLKHNSAIYGRGTDFQARRCSSCSGEH